MTDVTTLTYGELLALSRDVSGEIRKREVTLAAPIKADALSRDVLSVEGVQQGDPWRQPQGAHDAYPTGWVVTHNGKEWESLTAANVWEPGVSGWREIVPETEPPAAWVQPTGAHDAYPIGSQVTHNGFIWTSLVGANVWEPTDANASLWQKGEAV
jgi:hypothetical protein